jgi:hypothetical protein
MTAVCPSGHASATTDYCDQCGAPIAGAPTPTQEIAAPNTVEDADTSASPPQQPCPACGAPRSGDDRFCEGCGHDFLAPTATLPPAWEVVIQADRGYFERFAVTGLSFPAERPERRVALEGEQLRIGRSRAGGSDPIPEIDIGGPAEDPGVSRLHAVLVRQENGSWAIRDLGSTNGTTINDDPKAMDAEAVVPLTDGDRIRLGVWTTITLRRR